MFASHLAVFVLGAFVVLVIMQLKIDNIRAEAAELKFECRVLCGLLNHLGGEGFAAEAAAVLVDTEDRQRRDPHA